MKIQFDIMQKHYCPVCKGDISCSACNGTGNYKEDIPFGVGKSEKICPACNGSGRIPHTHRKSGSGRSRKGVNVSVKIK